MIEEDAPTTSSGNVFADLGVSHPNEALAKAELAHEIAKIIKKRRITQAKAAEVLGIDQAKVSALTRGQLRGFSTDRLFRFLNALGQDIEIRVKRKPESRDSAQVDVVVT
jgi:predicted XRE-type DNA-binding protein